MKTTLFYIHGLGSDRHSRKFLNLQEFFHEEFDYDFIEWNHESDISKLLNEAKIKLENTEKPILIGDSTGANFAYQLRDLLHNQGKESILILTSPLLNIEERIADFEFPKSIIPQLKKIDKPQNALIITTRNDKVLNQNWLFSADLENVKLVEVDDNHRLEKFYESLPKIREYIEENQKY